jgi:nucleotide-binding universal stress UspA family protein
MKRFKDILCVVDQGESSPALERAAALAESSQARLTVVDVIDRLPEIPPMPEGGPAPADVNAAILEAHRQRLASLVEPHTGRVEIQTRILQGVPFLEIIREVIRNGRDLVLKAAEDPDWLDRLFGSDDMHLLRKCPCPVWLVRPEATGPYRRILAAVDVDDTGSPEELQARHALNLQILQMAGSLALSEFAELHVVHVWDAFGESAMRGAFMGTPEQQINAYVEQVRRQHAGALDRLLDEVRHTLGREAVDYIEPRTHLVKGWARREIPALAKRIESDLVVMGTVARTGIPGFIIGNTAETILNQLECAVLAVKPPGFQTPVTAED